MNTFWGNYKHNLEFDVNQYWLDRELKATHDERVWIGFNEHLRTDAHDYVKTLQSIETKLAKKIEQNKRPSALVKRKGDIIKIEDDIAKNYKIECHNKEFKNLSDKAIYSLMINSPYSRLRFLLEKRQFLVAMRDDGQENKLKKIKLTKPKITVLYVAKKSIRYTWRIIRHGLPRKITDILGPVLQGSLSFITYAVMGVQSARLAYVAYKKEKTRQRKTKIATGVASFFLAGLGAGFGVSIIAEYAGAVVSGAAMTIAPVVISACLVGMYGLSLWRKSYILHQAKKLERHARCEYEDALVVQDDLRDDIYNLEQKRDAIGFKVVQDILHKINHNDELSEVEAETYTNYKSIMSELSAKESAYGQLKHQLRVSQKHVYHLRQERLQAERNVAFTAVLTTVSILSVVGVVLATAAFVGASVASIGAIPLALFIAGSVMAVGCKIFKVADGRNDFVYTKALRSWFTGKPEEPEPYKEVPDKKADKLNLKEEEHVSVLYKKLSDEDRHDLHIEPAVSVARHALVTPDEEAQPEVLELQKSQDIEPLKKVKGA